MEVTEYYDEERSFDTSVPSVLGLTEGFSLSKRIFYHVTNHSFYCVVIVLRVILIFTRKFEWWGKSLQVGNLLLKNENGTALTVNRGPSYIAFYKASKAASVIFS